MKRLILFNASILTDYGDFRFELLTSEQAKELIHNYQNENKEIISAIGHQATAEIMSKFSNIDCKNRLEFTQKTDEAALIFKLKKRAEEGEIFSRAEVEEVGFEFGVLTKTQ